MKKFNRKDYLLFCGSGVLIVVAFAYQIQFQAENQVFFPRPLSDDDIKKYSNIDQKSVVIYPIFTQEAYKVGGFYDYYKGVCTTCNTVSIRPLDINATYVTGLNSFQNLVLLRYPVITDIDVDQHPEILNDYDKIILLHNEYVTKTEFDAISNHKNVIYLYPNSLYVEVAVDYASYKMSLVRGHGYPEKSIGNGFDYVTDSSHEYDLNCKNYKWEQRPNGIEPTCWPEFLIKSDRNVLQIIKDFPKSIPTLVIPPKQTINVTSLGNCDPYGNCR